MTSHWKASSYKREPGESGFTNRSHPSFPPHSPVPFLCPLTVFTDQWWHHYSKQYYNLLLLQTHGIVKPINDIHKNTFITLIALTSHWKAWSYKREPGESGFTNRSHPSFPPHSPVLFLCPLTVFTDQYWHHHSKQYYNLLLLLLQNHRIQSNLLIMIFTKSH